MEIIVQARITALATWREQGYLEGYAWPNLNPNGSDERVSPSLNFNELIEIRLGAEEISRVETTADSLIYYRRGWRPPGPDRGDRL